MIERASLIISNCNINQSDVKRLKNSIKFNRKQQVYKGEKKKHEPVIQISKKICFISPGKSIDTLRSQKNSQNDKSQSVNLRQRFAQSKQQSFILTCQSPKNHEQKMNDSILSLYQELYSQRQKRLQDEMKIYRSQLERLGPQIQHLRRQNRSLKSRIKDVDMIQDFLMERQAYISEITTKNIDLNENINIISNQKAQIERIYNQLRVDYENQQRMYENFIEQLKRQVEKGKKQNNSILKINNQLKNQLKQNQSSNTTIQNVINLNRCQYNQNLKSSPNKIAKSKSNGNLTQHQLIIPFQNEQKKNKKTRQNKFISEKLSFLDEYNQNMQYKESELSFSKARSLDEEGILKILHEKPQCCQCKRITKDLKQKMKYYQIEVDILKRTKLETDKLKDENNRLKNYNKRLREKIDKFGQNSKNRRSKDSDQSLQLSLSPKKV